MKGLFHTLQEATQSFVTSVPWRRSLTPRRGGAAWVSLFKDFTEEDGWGSVIRSIDHL